MNTSPIKLLPRDSFGALIIDPADRAQVRTLLTQAIAAGKLTAEYNQMEYHKRHGYLGWCLNYAVYDVTATAILVQRRETERTKYGTSPQKDYVLIRKCGRGVTVHEVAKDRVVKLAWGTTRHGEIIDQLEGRTGETRTAYKILEQRADGSLVSVYDGSAWALGKTRRELATSNHQGGLYVFPTKPKAKEALLQGAVFAAARQAGKTLVLVACDVGGQQFHIGKEHSKLCVSTCRPVRIIETLSNPVAATEAEAAAQAA